ncbi:MAG: CDP-6-deoxy-delta-3,4-glucoseen reductase [Gammaproteobacteria bacterium]|nr:CDP-6-deoxy-delta-3,4-glucoseen reductase [Gammaproteobacteria bacterium]
MTFKVRIESSGREFSVQDKETVLAAALRQGITLAYSCRNGACGTCKARIVSGRVDYGSYEDKALSEAEKSAGAVLLCQAVPLTDLVVQAKEINAAKDIPIRIMPCRVMQLQKLAHDVMQVSLKLAEGQRLQFLAGQYIDILLSGNLRRSFSLATAPSTDELLQLHIRHVPDGHFTEQVFSKMKERDLLRFQGPLGTFFLREESDSPAILVAGGTGFAPMKSILEHAFAQGFQRPLHLYWGARARRDLYLDELPRSWAQKYPNFRYTPVLSETRPEDQWTGRQGWVHAALIADYPDLSRHEVYASGPPPMIDALKQAVKVHGLKEDRLYYDSFEFAHIAAKV